MKWGMVPLYMVPHGTPRNPLILNKSYPHGTFYGTPDGTIL